MGSFQEWVLMFMCFLMVACPTAIIVLMVMLAKKRILESAREDSEDASVEK